MRRLFAGRYLSPAAFALAAVAALVGWYVK